VDGFGHHRLAALRAHHHRIEHLSASLVPVQQRPPAGTTICTLPQRTIDVMIG
jgi:hypothetical protein